MEYIASIVREGRMSLRKVPIFSELYYVLAQKIDFFTVTAVRAVIVGFLPLGTHDYLRTLCYSDIMAASGTTYIDKTRTAKKTNLEQTDSKLMR
jgi:hypothetical protein